MSPRMIKVQSCDRRPEDRVILEVEVKVAETSRIIKDMLELLGQEGGEVIPLPPTAKVVTGAILQKVFEWANHHKDDPPSVEDDCDNKNHTAEELSSWDIEFFNVDKKTLYQLILAANYLEMKGLLSMSCTALTKLMRGKTAEQIRKTFNILNDFTPEEEAQIRKENEWLEAK